MSWFTSHSSPSQLRSTFNGISDEPDTKQDAVEREEQAVREGRIQAEDLLNQNYQLHTVSRIKQEAERDNTVVSLRLRVATDIQVKEAITSKELLNTSSKELENVKDTFNQLGQLYEGTQGKIKKYDLLWQAQRALTNIGQAYRLLNQFVQLKDDLTQIQYMLNDPIKIEEIYDRISDLKNVKQDIRQHAMKSENLENFENFENFLEKIDSVSQELWENVWNNIENAIPLAQEAFDQKIPLVEAAMTIIHKELCNDPGKTGEFQRKFEVCCGKYVERFIHTELDGMEPDTPDNLEATLKVLDELDEINQVAEKELLPITPSEFDVISIYKNKIEEKIIDCIESVWIDCNANEHNPEKQRSLQFKQKLIQWIQGFLDKIERDQQKERLALISDGLKDAYVEQLESWIKQVVDNALQVHFPIDIDENMSNTFPEFITDIFIAFSHFYEASQIGSEIGEKQLSCVCASKIYYLVEEIIRRLSMFCFPGSSCITYPRSHPLSLKEEIPFRRPANFILDEEAIILVTMIKSADQGNFKTFEISERFEDNGSDIDTEFGENENVENADNVDSDEGSEKKEETEEHQKWNQAIQSWTKLKEHGMWILSERIIWDMKPAFDQLFAIKKDHGLHEIESIRDTIADWLNDLKDQVSGFKIFFRKLCTMLVNQYVESMKQFLLRDKHSVHGGCVKDSPNDEEVSIIRKYNTNARPQLLIWERIDRDHEILRKKLNEYYQGVFTGESAVIQTLSKLFRATDTIELELGVNNLNNILKRNKCDLEPEVLIQMIKKREEINRNKTINILKDALGLEKSEKWLGMF